MEDVTQQQSTASENTPTSFTPLTSDEKTSGPGSAYAGAESALGGLEEWLVNVLKDAPHIPEGGRKVVVDFAPWIALVFGVLGIVSMLSVAGLSVFATLFTLGMALPMFVSIILGLVSSVLLLMSFNGLKERTKKGWNFVFYSQVVSIASGIASVLFGHLNGLVGLAVGTVIGFWILFEVRSHYNK